MLSEFNPARLHPLLVHLPIGLLFVALLMQGLQWWGKHQHYRAAIGLSLLSGAVLAIFSVLSGWRLALEGGYEQVVLDRHRWLGLSVALGAVLAWWGQRTAWRPWQKAYPSILILTNVSLILAGHYGGVMTHGADYLFSQPVKLQRVANIQEAAVYEVVIAPLLAQKCMGCHKASKSKGELRLDEPEFILAGGESGTLFNDTNAIKSLLLERIHLPLEAEEHMPPDGKPQLSSAELNLLRWWIENDHCFDCKVKELSATADIQLALQAYEAPQDHWSQLDLAPVSAKRLGKLRAVGVSVMPLAEGSPFLSVDVARKNIDKKMLRALRPVRAHIVLFRAGFSDFSDAEAGFLAGCHNLRKLELQATAITDESLESIKKLAHLQSLNLYKTGVTDEGLQHLSEMKTLQQLYLWQSKVSKPQAMAVQEKIADLEVLYAPEDSIFGRSALNPPVLEARTSLFYDSVIVRLSSNVKGIKAYYTLDGTTPDTNAYLLKDSLILRESAQLKVIQTKNGWLPSSISEKDFVKAGQKIEEAQLLEPASGKYTANGAASLIDLQKGSTTFTDGNWLGYEGKHIAALLKLGQERSLNSLSISMLSRPASWIFFPKGIKIYTSIDGENFQLATAEKWPVRDKEIADVEMKYFTVDLPEGLVARYVQLEVESPLRNPDWHPNPGGKSWMFIDEILVN